MMKEIYTISLDEDIPLSPEVSSDIREIASFLYDELDRYDCHVLCLRYDRKLMRNDLLEMYNPNSNTYKYSFISDKSKNNIWNYEPFMLDYTSFGFTAYEGTIKEDDIYEALGSVMRFLNKNYKFKVASLKYMDKNENARYEAIKSLYVEIEKQKNTKKRIKKKTRQILPSLRV